MVKILSLVVFHMMTKYTTTYLLIRIGINYKMVFMILC